METYPRPRDRDAAIRWARFVLDQPGAIFLDTETTGLGEDAEIIDLAIVGAAGEILVDQLVRPLSRIPADASFVHGISNRDVESAPAWCDLWPSVRELLEGRVVVAYNTAFDERLVTQTCQISAVTPVASDWQCAMRAYTAFLRSPQMNRRHDRWHSLTNAARQLGIAEPTHRALADAVACREVVVRIAESNLAEF